MSKIIPGTKAFKSLSATVSSAAKTLLGLGFSQAEIDRADLAYITPTTAGVRALWSGSTPTTSFGHLIASGGTESVVGNSNLQNLALIREAAADSAVTVTLETYEY